MSTSYSSPPSSASRSATGFWPSLFASVVASLCYNFFFLPPLYTFTITDPTNVAAFLFFTVMQSLSPTWQRGCAPRLFGQERARTDESLYAFSRKLAGVGTLDDVLWATAYQTASMLKVRVVLLLPEDVRSRSRPAIRRKIRSKRPILPPPNGHGSMIGRRAAVRIRSPAPNGSFCRCVPAVAPLASSASTATSPVRFCTPDQRRLLDASIDQAALAIERVPLVEDMDRAKRRAEADRLRSALLTSISHDLKTPLAAILGAAGTLRGFARDLDDQGKVDLLSTIVEESERLNRFIANLLDMTRLESGVDRTEHFAAGCR